MKKNLLILFFILIAFAGKAQMVTCGSPLMNLGLPITFCAQVKGTSTGTVGKNSGTLLFLCGDYPHQAMTIVIKDTDPPLFKYTLEEWIGKTICVNGTVGVFKGKQYMVVRKHTQLTIN